MEEKVRHHYVPRTYLKRFALEKSKDQFFLHSISPSDLQSDKIKCIHINNLCVANKLYTLPANTVEERMLVEDFYSDAYEKHYSIVYQKLTDSAINNITDEDRRVIIGMVTSLFYRNISWNQFHNNFHNDMLKRAFHLSKENGNDSFFWEDREVSIKGKTIEDLKKQFEAEVKPLITITQMQAAIKLLRLRIDSDSIHITKVTNPKHEFLTSDHPVSVIDPDGNKHVIPINPQNFFSLPIDSKHQLSLVPNCPAESKHLIFRSHSDGFGVTLTNNVQQIKQADKFLLGSEDGLKSFVSVVSKMSS